MPKHGYSGEFMPGKVDIWPSKTFSVGIFELIPRKSRHGLKAGPVKVRVRGRVEDDALVYKKAEEIIWQLDRGTYEGPKTVTIKTKEEQS